MRLWLFFSYFWDLNQLFFVEQSRSILKKFWGFDAFRPLQEDIVDAAIYGKDVLALLPTGGGKSICFQVPGIAREGVCLVISPLIALMHDQVNQLQKKGIRAKAITRSSTRSLSRWNQVISLCRAIASVIADKPGRSDVPRRIR